jgi:hypothetical protein
LRSAAFLGGTAFSLPFDTALLESKINIKDKQDVLLIGNGTSIRGRERSTI